MITPKSLPGMDDILPGEIEKWQALEQKARDVFCFYGYPEIRTPLLEETSLFRQSVGGDTEIVQKQMFSFDQGNPEKEICLRPEQTASIVRAYIEHSIAQKKEIAKYYYLGSMFRKERPQKGRKRQFYQIGAEAIGSSSFYLDTEIICLAAHILQAVKVDDYQIEINSIGCRQCQPNYKAALKKYFQDKIKLLCPDCQRRFETNILRILDCKKEGCQPLIQKIPSTLNYLCANCDSHFKGVQDVLGLIGISYVVNQRIVRGLDYYTSTVFEITHHNLGSQNALAAGGRYDNLIEQMGGGKQPAVGFSLGLERVIAVSRLLTEKPSLFVFFAALGQEAYQESYKIMQGLRKKAIACEIDYQNKSLKAQMRLADKLEAKYTAILGEKELDKGVIILRNMQTKEQKEIKLENAYSQLRRIKQR
ncbi:MAG: histidine--tRNA ligase [Candidatus Omnitrophica bacterium]|nr:histidine--tRNA ligase [Candidatus Omnitrophota bacterium]